MKRCPAQYWKKKKRRMLRMELPGKRNRGRPKRRFVDAVREDMAVATRGGRSRKRKRTVYNKIFIV